MDCAQFESLLFRGLDREIPAADRPLMRSHERNCARCHRLASLVRGDRTADAAELEHTLVAQIVANTSGTPCEQARLLLTSDEIVPSGDRELLTRHLEICADCASVSRALARARHALPALAEADPGEDFVASVMTATLGYRQLVPDSRQSRLRRVWQRLVERPRIASEIAYTITMSVLLVFGLPSPSLSELPARAVEAAWRTGASVERVLTERTGEAAQTGRTRWADLTVGAASGLERSVETSSAETVERLRAWSGAAQRFAWDVHDTVIVPNLESLRSLWNESGSAPVERNTGELDNTQE